MILVSYVRQLQKRGRTLEQAVEEAAITRLRPVLMTTLVACLRFVPMAFSTGMGAEVQRPHHHGGDWRRDLGNDHVSFGPGGAVRRVPVPGATDAANGE